MAHRMRRTLVLVVSAAAALMTLSSAAFACTNFLGEMVVQYNGTGATTATSTAHGAAKNAGMTFCNHDGNRANMTSFATGSSSGGDTVTVKVQPYTCAGPGAKQTQIGAATNYYINGMHGAWDDTNGTGSQDCMSTNLDSPPGPATRLGGPYTVTSSTTQQSFTSNAWTPGPGGGSGSLGYTVVCFDVANSQTNDSAPEINSNMNV